MYSELFICATGSIKSIIVFLSLIHKTCVYTTIYEGIFFSIWQLLNDRKKMSNVFYLKAPSHEYYQDKLLIFVFFQTVSQCELFIVVFF